MIDLQKNEKILYKGKPEKRTLWLWIITNVFGLAFLFFLSFAWLPVLWYFIAKDIFNTLLPIFNSFIAGFILILSIIAIYQTPLLKTHKYYITNQKVCAEAGLLFKRKRSIPFCKITDITISQNIFEQMFKLVNLRIHTAGMGGPQAEISFVGLEDASIPEKIISDVIK